MSPLKLLVGLGMAVALLGQAPSAWAGRLKTDRDDYAQCVASSARAFGVQELAIWVILDVEAGTVGRVSKNTDGSVDIGPMQVNSWWLGRIAKFGISESQLKNDLCTNIYVGTWIYASELKRHGSVARAIAYYHSPTPRHQHRYLGLVQQAIQRRLSAVRRESEA